jgi:hypothetical protein
MERLIDSPIPRPLLRCVERLEQPVCSLRVEVDSGAGEGSRT